MLALIIAARKEVTVIQAEFGPRNPKAVPEGLYYAYSSYADEKMSELCHALFRLTGNPRTTVVELHSHWKYSVLTPEDIEREYEAAQSKSGKKSEAPPEGGFSDAWRNRPSEVDHLFDFYASRTNWNMTFSAYWAHERKQRAARKQKERSA
jgi:hypothetical protein